MQIEKAVFDILSANGAVLALCPAARIFPDGEIQNVELPSIKHRVVADKSIYTHEGRVSLRQCDFYQVSIYAATTKAARAIAEVCIAALSGAHVVDSEGIHGFHMNSNQLPFDEDIRCVGLALDFEFWYGT